MGMTREQAIKEYVIPALKNTWGEKINKEVLEALEQEDVTWIVGNDNVQIAVKNMPVDMMQKINAIIGNLQEPTTKNDCAEQNGCITCSLDDGDDCCRKLYEESMQEPTTKNCESCGYYGLHHEVCNYCYKCSLWTKGEPTTKNDLRVNCISREDALMCLTGEFEDKQYEPSELVSIFSKRIKHLPPVTAQEPRKGHWIYDYTSADGHKTYHCSECGCYLQPKHSEPLNSFKWCSLCGADMRKVEE